MRFATKNSTVAELARLVPAGSVVTDLPLAPFTNFRCGGNADIAVFPSNFSECRKCWCYCRRFELPVTVLGGGANVLVADDGIAGVVLFLERLQKWFCSPDGCCTAQAGVSISQLAWSTASSGLQGLEFFFAMPGSLGGALFMNARCYGGEIAPLVSWHLYLDHDGNLTREQPTAAQWAYKKSPYQERSGILLAAGLRLRKGTTLALQQQMLSYRNDRWQKGHYRFANAGSFFKNNRSFGVPTGKLISDAGLCGLRSREGRAMVAPWHGNILANLGGATATEIRQLAGLVKDRVLQQYGFLLEEEVCFIGKWTNL